jgi:branched-chain amino acid transport system permease protein
MSQFISILFAGMSQGAIFGLVALGIVLLFKTTGVVNFAQGDLLTVGAYFGVWLVIDLKIATALAYLISIALCFLVGVVIERIGYAPLRRRSLLSIVIATFALSLLIQSIIILVFTSQDRTLPGAFNNAQFRLWGANIQYQDILVIGVTLFILVAVEVMLRFTTIGRQVRALASDRDASLLQGIRASGLSMLMFGLSAACAGVGGLLIAPLLAVSPTFGFTLLLSAFAAVVIGGFDRPTGAVLAAIGIGVVTEMAGGYISSNWNEAWPYIILLGILVVKPEGLVKASVGVRY